MDEQPCVLLEIRATLKDCLKALPAEFVYKTSLTLRWDFLAKLLTNQWYQISSNECVKSLDQ